MRVKSWLTTVASAAVVLSCALPGAVLAWGSHGHRIIGEESVRALPAYMPAFLRTTKAAMDIGELAREPDRWRDAGKTHDDAIDPGHFIDLNDDGTTLAGVPLEALPQTRDDFSALLRTKGTTLFKSGWLPYAEVEYYQQVVKDMAFWRVLSYLETHETDKAKKAWYHADRLRREALTVRDIGVLTHFVGDATQPMHVSVHYNGWGKYPNPGEFTQEHIHWPLESAFVGKSVTSADVRAGMAAYMPCTQAVNLCFATRLERTRELIVPLFQLEKDGGFKDGDPRGKAFMVKQIAQGASDVRDVLLDAWRDSKTVGVGYPSEGTAYDDFVAGKVKEPFAMLHGDE